MSALSNEDGCAVDLLLENAQYASHGPACFTQASSAEMQERLARVESLFVALDTFQASEPPQDLASKTLARCANAMPFKAAEPGEQTSVTARP